MKTLFTYLFQSLGSDTADHQPLSRRSRVALTTLILMFSIGVGHIWGGTDSKTETFEDQTAGTTYNSTQTYTAAESNAGIAWTIYYGSVSATNAITDSHSCLMRYYTGSPSNLGYAQTTTPIKGLKNVTFNAKVTQTGCKMGVWYSTDGKKWTAIQTGINLTTSSNSMSYDIPNSNPATNYYIKIGLTAATTNKKDLIIDDIQFTWTTFAVTYNGNENTGGSVPTDATKYTSGSTVTVKGNTGSLVKTGYIFSGWNTQADGNGTNYTAGAGTFSITADMTLYAKWEAASSTETPTFSVGSGTYNNNQSVSLSCETDGATIYYTTDGSTPTSSSTTYTGAITVSADNTTIKAIAIKGGDASAVASATYRLTCATPKFSPTGGSYDVDKNVTITSATTSASIYYTTDGSDPTASSTLYEAPVSVNSTQTIKAIAIKSNYTNSAVASAEYTITIPATVAFNTGTGNPTQDNITEASYGAGITLPAGPTPACSADGWTFAGWGYSSCDDESTEPTLLIAGNKYYPNGNETLYAVYVKNKAASTNYRIISNGAEIVSGEDYVIAAYKNSNDYAITAETYSTYYIKQTAVTVSASNIIASPVANIIWKLTKETATNVSLYNTNQKKYLYVYASDTYRNLGLTDTKRQFIMTEEKEAGYSSTFAFASSDYSTYYINYDATHTDFGTKTSSDENLYLYKKTYTGTYESNPFCCDNYDVTLAGSPTGNATGGTFSVSPTTACEGTEIHLTHTASTGYNFSSWTISKTSNEEDVTDEVTLDGNDFLMPAYGVTINATFAPITYTIDLKKNNDNDDADDGVAYVTYLENSLDDIVDAEYQSGYSLLGYYTADDGGDKIIDDSGNLISNIAGWTDENGRWVKTTNADLYAHWKPTGTWNIDITNPSHGSISVTWNDGSEQELTSGNEYVAANTELTISSTPDAGYERTALTVNGSAHTSGDTHTLTEDITVAATFSPISYSITYNLNGGTGVSNSSYTIESEAITLPTAPTISRTGYTFAGWYANSDLSTGGVQTTIAAGSTGAKEYWAKWDVNTYTLSFDANGGTGSMSAIADWAYNTTDALPTNNFSLTDYRFLGWAISDERADAGTVDYADGADYTMGAGNATLYAVWKHQVYNDWVFSCAELTLTPKLVTASTPIFITSAANQTVRSQDSILISGTGLTPSATLTFPDLPSQFSIKSRTNGDLTTTAEGTINAVAYIFYTPDGEATEDGLDNIDALNVKVPGAKPRQATLSDTKIQGRHLPENFIIAAKRAGQWYALPANMTETTTPAPIEITVDDNNDPTIVLGVSTNVLGLRGMDKTGTYTIANAGQYIKLGMTNNPTYGNYPLFGSTTSSIGKGGAATSVSGNIGKQYWWLMTQTNTTVENAAEAKYNVYSANNSTNHLRLKENAGNPIWGLYDSGIEELRLIPYLAENIEATITGWTQKDVELELEEAIEGGNADGVTAQLNEVTADANTLSGSETNYRANFPSSIDFAGKNGQQLTLVWKRSGSVVGGSIITIPSIVAPSEEVSSWSDIAATESDIIVINKPITIDVSTAVAKEIVLNRDNDATGQLTIAADQALVVTGKIQVEKDGVLRPTTAADLKVESSAAGNGTLIFENDDNAATVEMYSIGSTDGWKWQYIGVPFDGANAQATYYGAYLYKWNNGWTAVQKSDELEEFAGYCISYPAANYTYVMDGTLAPTTEQSITVPAGKSMVVGNSWTAPIQITQLEDEDFDGLLKNVYLYNTGNDKNHSASTTSSPTGDAIYAAGTYISVPIHSAEYTGVKVISSLQGFFVKNNSGSAGTLSLSYSKHVRPSGENSVVNGPMHAPKRVADETDRPAVLKMKVSGSQYDDRLILLEREDFTTGYDAGWDGDKMGDVATSPRITTTREDGTADAVAALPDLEGTLINFRAASTDDQYTLYFDYETEDAEPLYLLDLSNNAYTRVETGSSYTFFTTDKADHKRFALTRYRAPQITTGVEDASENNGQGKAVKFIENDKLYILRNGVLYDGTGKKVIEN